MKTCLFLVTSTLLALLVSPAARAQMSPDLIMKTYNSNISVIANGAINKSLMESAIARNNSGGNAGRGTAAATRTRAATSVSTTYTPTLRKQTVQATVDRLKTSNPAASQAIATTFGPGKYDHSQTYREILKGTGLRENDAADALACYMLMGWVVVHNVQDDKAITIPMAQGVRAQIAPLLASNGQMRNRAGQVGEELKLQTVVVQGGWQSAIKEGKLAAYKQGINNLFRNQYGLDMNQFKLTNQGFAKN